jgi:hypothetical protein
VFGAQQASVIKSLLGSYIPCHYSSELPSLFYRLRQRFRADTGFLPSLAEEARRILSEHRRQQVLLRLVED